MPKISVIVVTNRNGYRNILLDDMLRQTFRDFEVIVADDFGFTTIPSPFKEFIPRQKNESDVWNLNKAYNDCLDRAKGELLVFLQDFIWIPDDGLQRFWDDYQKYPNAFITGVGHKAQNGLEGISEIDHRMIDGGGLRLCDHFQTPWELNWSCAPRALMPRFNEKMDMFYGGENLYISHAAVLKGAQIAIDHDNVCIGYSQAECGGRPENWEEMHCNKHGRLAAFIKYLDLTHKNTL